MRKNKRARTIRLVENEVPEFLRTVYDDLAFLQSIKYSSPSRTDIRFASAVLRRLLHEDMLAAAWEFAAMGGQAHINAVDLEGMIADVPKRYIHYGYAGGAPTDPARHSGYVLQVIPKADVGDGDRLAKAAEVSKLMRPHQRRDFSLDEFCQSASAVSGPAMVSRVDVVRYVANKLGGVHWDNERGGWTTPQGSRHRLLDENHVVVGALTGPLYEVISIAHALASAADISRLMNHIEARAPEPPVSSEVIRFRAGRVGDYSQMTVSPPSTSTRSAHMERSPDYDHVLTLWGVQESLLQSYRALFITVQSILFAISASIASSAPFPAIALVILGVVLQLTWSDVTTNRAKDVSFVQWLVWQAEAGERVYGPLAALKAFQEGKTVTVGTKTVWRKKGADPENLVNDVPYVGNPGSPTRQVMEEWLHGLFWFLWGIVVVLILST